MATVVKSLGTRAFFQLCSDLKREHYSTGGGGGASTQRLWIAVFIMFVFFVWAIYALIRYQQVLPAWVVILGIVLLFIPAGPLLTLILEYYSLASFKEEGAAEGLDATEGLGGGTEGLGGRHLRSRPELSRAPSQALTRPVGRQGGRMRRRCPRHSHYY